MSSGELTLFIAIIPERLRTMVLYWKSGRSSVAAVGVITPLSGAGVTRLTETAAARDVRTIAQNSADGGFDGAAANRTLHSFVTHLNSSLHWNSEPAADNTAGKREDDIR